MALRTVYAGFGRFQSPALSVENPESREAVPGPAPVAFPLFM